MQDCKDGGNRRQKLRAVCLLDINDDRQTGTRGALRFDQPVLPALLPNQADPSSGLGAGRSYCCAASATADSRAAVLTAPERPAARQPSTTSAGHEHASFTLSAYGAGADGR
jgi:hypothetical protein